MSNNEITKTTTQQEFQKLHEIISQLSELSKINCPVSDWTIFKNSRNNTAVSICKSDGKFSGNQDIDNLFLIITASKNLNSQQK